VIQVEEGYGSRPVFQVLKKRLSVNHQWGNQCKKRKDREPRWDRIKGTLDFACCMIEPGGCW
jgi:hypothetical protein